MSYKYADYDGLLYYWQKLKSLLANKVDVVTGKGLSTNDYTTAEKTKLSGIATGAEVNVQADWNVTDTGSDAYIANKPTIPSGVVVDSALSDTSTNAVQNKVVKAAIDLKADTSALPAVGTSTPKIDGTAAVGTSTAYARQDHVHPTDTTRAALASPTFTGTPAAPTASAGTNTTQLATTAFVTTAVSNGLATVADAIVYKGTLGTGGTITALPTTYKVGWEYRVITAGTYAGQACEVGDLIVAVVARSGSGNVNSDWTVAQGNIDGYALSTDLVSITNAEIDTIFAS